MEEWRISPKHAYTKCIHRFHRLLSRDAKDEPTSMGVAFVFVFKRRGILKWHTQGGSLHVCLQSQGLVLLLLLSNT